MNKVTKPNKPSRTSVRFGTGISSSLKAVPLSDNTNSIPRDEAHIDYKHLYISRLEPTTSVDDIMNYIRENVELMGANRIKCRKLLAAGKKTEGLSFISFKISLIPADFDILSNPTNWPENVAVREFEDKPKAPKATASFFPRDRLPNQH